MAAHPTRSAPIAEYLWHRVSTESAGRCSRSSGYAPRLLLPQLRTPLAGTPSGYLRFPAVNTGLRRRSFAGTRPGQTVWRGSRHPIVSCAVGRPAHPPPPFTWADGPYTTSNASWTVISSMRDKGSMVAAGPAQRAGRTAPNLTTGRVFRRDLKQSFPPAARNPQPRVQYHPGHGDRCCARRQQSPALLLQHLAMLVKDASQFVIENLAGLGAISRIISHTPSMSDLDGQPAHRGTTGQRLLSAAAAQAAPAIGQTRPSPGQVPASEHASPRCARGFPGTDQPVQVGHACQACRRGPAP